MLLLKLQDAQKVVIHTPGGDITLVVFSANRVGIDAPKAYHIDKVADTYQGRTLHAQEVPAHNQ